MTTKVLCVDDEPNILQAFERQLRGQFTVYTAIGPERGLQAITENGPFAVVVSDLRMPGMNGIEFLARVRDACPDTVRIVLTGDADLSAAIGAVNDGRVFQFLTKPCPGNMLTRALEAALEQHRLITAERELLENTLNGSIGVMTEILSLVNPAAFSCAQRIYRYVRHMAQNLKLATPWRYELAAMLSQIGCVTVPPNILEKSHAGELLDATEQGILSSQGRTAHKLLVKIPRLEEVAEMVAHQHLCWLEIKDIPDPVRTGAHLLKIARDLDEQVMRGNSLQAVVLEMHRNRDYNPAFVIGLRELHLEQARSETRFVPLCQLRPRMIVNTGIYSKTGLLLLAKGQEVTESAIARLEGFASLFGIVEPISVIIPNTERPPDVLEGTSMLDRRAMLQCPITSQHATTL